MGQTVFAKYHKGLKLSQGIEIINHLKSNGACLTNYYVHCECFCTQEELKSMFEKNSISVIDTIADQGICSITNTVGIWSCIKLISNKVTLVIYTAGADNIMYYSFL